MTEEQRAQAGEFVRQFFDGLITKGEMADHIEAMRPAPEPAGGPVHEPGETD